MVDPREAENPPVRTRSEPELAQRAEAQRRPIPLAPPSFPTPFARPAVISPRTKKSRKNRQMLAGR